jgi:peptidoglycan/LPS O-acetylase OafA/YrhL
MRHRPDIDGLRAVAVIPVVLFHAGVPSMSGGYVGVDVFFVISGYLISKLIKEEVEAGNFSIIRFYDRRIRRILPALVFAVALTWACAYVLLLPSYFADFAKSVVSVSLFSSNVYFWKASGYFQADAQLRPLLHTWSLGVEEQFYIVMPIAAIITARFLRAKWLLVFGLAALASFALSVFAMNVAPTANFFLLPTRAWELLVGGLLAMASPIRIDARPLREALAMLGLALILGAVLLYDAGTPFPGYTALAPSLGAALIIFAGGCGPTLVGSLLSLRPMQAVGLISYSVYLVHWPIAVFVRYQTLHEPDPLTILAIVLASLVLGAFSWRYIEQPFRKRGSPAMPMRAVMAGGVALIAMAGIGMGSLSTGPLQTASPEIALLQSNEISWRNGRCFFEDGGAAYAEWRADQCTLTQSNIDPVMIWGDSFAAHYAPGIVSNAGAIPSKVYLYAAAGCPPVLSYFSYARPKCQEFNQQALHLIEKLGVRRVILAARWVDLQARGLDGIRTTLDALKRLNVDVTIIGQSPMFITDIAVIGARLDGATATGANRDVWESVVDQRLNTRLRALTVGAQFIDPTPHLCPGGLCELREDGAYLYFDYGHFSTLGSSLAVRRYLMPSLDTVGGEGPTS